MSDAEAALARVRHVRSEAQRHAARGGTGLALAEFLRGPVDDELQLLESMLTEEAETARRGLTTANCEQRAL